MSIEARYPGTCPECGGRFDKGDRITHDGRQSLSEPFGWRHVTCPDDPADATTLRTGEQVCTTCWLVHPEGACDR